jgi:hypothetical protein
MSFTRNSLIAAAVCASALGLAASAFAQNQPPGPTGAPEGAHPFMEHLKERMREHQAERTKALHDVLNIRADQEPAFQAFTAALHPEHDGLKGPHAPRQDGPSAAPPATTPERLDRVVARLHEREQRMESRVTAIKTFYAALSPEQQHTFDSLPLLRGGDWRGEDGGPRGHGGWGGPHA